MRKALIGILMAAVAAVPTVVQAQDSESREGRRAEARAERAREHYQAVGERNQARSERRQEAQTERVERQQVRQERVQEAPVQVRQERVQQAPVQQQQQSWSRRGGGDGQRNQAWSGGGQRGERWGGRGGQDTSRREAYQQQLDASREASRRGIEQSVGGNYARQGQRNQQRYERDLRQEYGVGQRGDRRGGGDWNRNGSRDNRWSDNQGGRRSNWNRNWRSDNRYDWQRYRYSNRNLFRSSGYYAPYRGYSYNRLNIGFILDSLFYSNRYWLGDPYQYRLPAAPYGTQWVRYYDDVVLVDVYTGEVLDVIYDFFW
jgi:hypothetical protein